MAQKVIKKNFSDFKGLHLGVNAISRSPEYCIEMKNWEVDEDGSLVNSPGQKGEHGNLCGDLNYATGLLKHVSSSLTTGAIQEKLLLIRNDVVLAPLGGRVHERREGKLTLAYGGAGSAQYRIVANTAGTDIVFELLVDGAVVLSFATSQGTVAINTLRNSINGTAGFSCTLTPEATINGNQTTGRTASVVVNAGHTFSIGDIVFDGTTANMRRVTQTSATTLNWSGRIDAVYTTDVTFTNGQKIGISNELTRILPITEETSVSSSPDIFLPYYAIVPIMDKEIFKVSPTAAYFTGFNGVNLSNCLYIGGKYPSAALGIMKYDGNIVARAGLSRPSIVSIASNVGGALTASSTYKYILILEQQDFQKNVITSRESAEVSGATTAVNFNLSVTFNNPNSTELYNYRSAVFTGGAFVNPTTVTVTAGHKLIPGDWVYLLDSVLNTSIQAQILSCTDTSITFTAAITGTINSGFFAGISTVLGKFYRTKAFGQVFYKVYQIPLATTGGTSTFTDNVADTLVGTRYDTPSQGFTHDPPPILHAVAEHQGLLVGIGDYNNPNSIYFSSPESPDYMDVLNTFDAPGASQGKLTALASDTESMLAIFKDTAYYNIVGDLISGNFSADIVTEGSVGCPSHLALCRVEEFLMFPSWVGFQRVRAGQIDRDFPVRLNAVFKNNTLLVESSTLYSVISPKFNIRRSIGINDFNQNKYICSLIVEGGAVGVSVSPQDTSRTFIYDYQKDYWSEMSMSNGFLMPYKGGTTYNSKPYWLSSAHLWIKNRTQTKYDYCSHEKPLTTSFIDQWEFAGEPSVDKQFLNLKLYRMIPEGSSESYNDISELGVLIKKNFSGDVGSWIPFVFSSPTSSYSPVDPRYEVSQKLPDTKLRAISIQIRTQRQDNAQATINQLSRITGYELLIALSNEKEQINK